MSVCKVWQWRESATPYPVLTDPKDPDAGVTIKNDRGQTFAVLGPDEFIYVHGLAAWKKLCAEQAVARG